MMTWIEVLSSIPELHLIDYLPDFLEGVFCILSDPNREIRQSAENLLIEFLSEIRDTAVVDLLPLTSILIRQSSSRDLPIRRTSVNWIHSFIEVGGLKLLPVYAGLFEAVMKCSADANEDLSSAAQKANSALLSLVQDTSVDVAYKPFIQTIAQELQSSTIVCKISALEWLIMLHTKSPVETNRHLSQLLPILLRTLSDDNAQVVSLTLTALARVSADDKVFSELITSLTQLFASDKSLLESRGMGDFSMLLYLTAVVGALIVRKLCALLDAGSVFTALAQALISADELNHNTDFVMVYTHALNIILLTAPETQNLRTAVSSDRFDLF